MRLFSMRSRWSRQTNFWWSLRIRAPGSRCDSQSTWKPLQMPEHRQPAPGGLDHLGHHRREAGDRAAAEVVAVGEPARQHDGVHPAQVVVAVPEGHDVRTAQADRPAGVDVVERAGEGDDADLHALDLVHVHLEVLDHRVGQQLLGDLVHLREPGGGELALDLELEALALAHPADPSNPSRGRAPCTALPWGSRISGLSMTSTTTRATGTPGVGRRNGARQSRRVTAPVPPRSSRTAAAQASSRLRIFPVAVIGSASVDLRRCAGTCTPPSAPCSRRPAPRR